MARRIPVEVKWVTLVVDNSECPTGLDGLAPRQGASFGFAIQRRCLNPRGERAESILCTFFKWEGEYLCPIWTSSRYNSYDDVVLFRTQNDGIRLPVAINISNSCGFSVPLDSWVRLPKAVYRNVRPGYLSTYRSAENGSHKEALGKCHLKTNLVA
jgi:hypothetical protein